MKIQEMFTKDITRDLQGVIVVGENRDAGVKQELEEYVVTRELQKHLWSFFTNYKKGLIGETKKTGVWISGFFGSGKSHFLKILSYMLGNRVVDGKLALQYLIDNAQIKDPKLLAEMKLAADTPTDVILFNIDSKSEQTGKQNKDAIVMVFLKVFNEMQGFYGSLPYLADLERQLSDDGRYDEFQSVFEKDYGSPWESSRNRFDFIQDTIVGVLDKMNYMSRESARNWCEKATEPYQISIENFAKMVRDYLDSKGENHHIVFLVDEVGQYIGDDSQLMLNLQTVREELSSKCLGRAWVVVTSQQDIDSITEVKGNDLDKIQGRFDTRISLSSANVDEVIKERILRKTPTAAQTLRLLYAQKETQIRNIITFNNTAEMKLYSDGNDFSGVYPFIPYQFHLLAEVLTSIRRHGASGKHLSEGERSMLALFKESAETLKDKEEGTLVPFYLFYDALENFLDASHSRVIRQAHDNRRINPDGAEDCFAVNVLKCLFLIKYVKEFENATLENITSLMISHVDEDRIALSDRIRSVLDILIKETLVQKHNGIYVFLTEEEQEIQHDINRENIEMGQIIGKLAEMIFDEIFTDKKYKYPKFNGRYTFPFNQTVDDRPYNATHACDIGVHILTPYTDKPKDDGALRLISSQANEVLVMLPDDRKHYFDDISQALKIEKYLRKNTLETRGYYEDIISKKRIEMRKLFDNAKQELMDALKGASFYVNGDCVEITAKDIDTRINEALGRLVDRVYHKLYYIDKACSEDDIRRMLTKSRYVQTGSETAEESNKMAQEDVLLFIKDNSDRHTKTSMKTLKDKFTKAPYGFVEDDVEWIVARLFKKNDIILGINGSPVTLSNKSSEELVKLLIRKEFVEKLLTEYRAKRALVEIRTVRELTKDIYGISLNTDDEDRVMAEFQEHAKKWIINLDAKLKYNYTQPYPGRNVVENGVKVLQNIVELHTPPEFYPYLVENSDVLKTFAENYEPIKAFFDGEQKNIFDKALQLLNIYEKSKNYIVDDELEALVALIREILKNQKPFRDIPKLPALLDTCVKAYHKVMDKFEAPVISDINEDRARVISALDTKAYKEQYHDNFHKQFDELIEKANHCDNVADLRNCSDQSHAVRMRLLKKLDDLDAEIEQAAAKKTTESAIDAGSNNKTDKIKTGDDSCEIRPKKTKRLAIKSVTKTSFWHIESKADIDHYIEGLKKQLMQELEDNTIVDIEF